MTGAVVYSYGVAWPFDPARVAHLRGVDGAAVSAIEHEGVVAVVSTLTSASANPRVLRARLERLDEVEALARAHHTVVDAIAAHTPIVPFRLATIHAGRWPVAQLLRRRHQQFVAALERVAGCAEIGVKVYALPDANPPGHRREDVHLDAATVAHLVQAELGDLAAESRLHRPQDPQLSGLPGENVLNAAYLVDEREVDQFVARAGRLGADAAAGVRVIVTGPWAPYSFADLEEAAP